MKLLSIGHDCYESYPCQHKCSFDVDGRSIETLVPATELVAYPELMDNDLLAHFAQYRLDLKKFIKTDDCDVVFAEQLKNLYKEKYLKHRDEVYEKCLRAVREVDIKQRLVKSLENGYSGFIIFQDPMYGSFSRKQLETLHNELMKKIDGKGLKDCLSIWEHTPEGIRIYVNALKLSLLQGEEYTIEEPYEIDGIKK